MTEYRWRCPKCSSDKVQIALPTYYRETVDFDLEFQDTATDGEILYWYCEECGGSDSGKPVDTLEVT